MTKNIGMILLAVLLILWGLVQLVGMAFQGLNIVLGVLAIAAAVFILIGR